MKRCSCSDSSERGEGKGPDLSEEGVDDGELEVGVFLFVSDMFRTGTVRYSFCGCPLERNKHLYTKI